MRYAHNGRNAVYGVTYVFLALIGAAMVGYAGDRTIGLLFGLLLLLVAAGGFVLVGFDAWFVRHRPGITLATAPSGVPATAFLRSPVPTVLSVVMPMLFELWALFGAVVANEPVVRVVLVLMGIGLATTLVAVVRGHIAPGGLYLTAAGIEQRKEAVSWSIPWEHVSGVVPGEPLALTLSGPPPVPVVRTRFLWQRESTGLPGVIAVDSRYLAEDPVVVAELVARCVVAPSLRDRMGTSDVVAELRRT